MDSQLVNGGGASIFVGITVWIWGRICGLVPIFAPLFVVGGVLMLLVGLVTDENGRD